MTELWQAQCNLLRCAREATSEVATLHCFAIFPRKQSNLLLSCYRKLDSLQNMTGLMWLRPPVTLIRTNGGEWMDGLD